MPHKFQTRRRPQSDPWLRFRPKRFQTSLLTLRPKLWADPQPRSLRSVAQLNAAISDSWLSTSIISRSRIPDWGRDRSKKQSVEHSPTDNWGKMLHIAQCHCFWLVANCDDLWPRSNLLLRWLYVRRRTTCYSGSPLLKNVTSPPITSSKVPPLDHTWSTSCTCWSSPTCSRRSSFSSRPAATPSSTHWPVPKPSLVCWPNLWSAKRCITFCPISPSSTDYWTKISVRHDLLIFTCIINYSFRYV